MGVQHAKVAQENTTGIRRRKIQSQAFVPKTPCTFLPVHQAPPQNATADPRKHLLSDLVLKLVGGNWVLEVRWEEPGR